MKLSGGKQKGKNMIFDLNLVERKTLEETMISFYISRYHFSQISRTSFRIIRKKFLSQIFTFLMDSLKPFHLFNDQNLLSVTKVFLLMLAYIDSVSIA